jgi:regulation of enolase protein 1 (concanavalin A-like superfamily)
MCGGAERFPDMGLEIVRGGGNLLPIKSTIILLIASVVCCPAQSQTSDGSNDPSGGSEPGPDHVLFQDDFRGGLGKGWHWLREHKDFWRVTPPGLEVRLEPGNMWGPQNDARNVLLRAAPPAITNQIEIEISVTVQNQPTNQYEQTDLVWYLDDSNMVKLGQELVDGKLSVVMGREEKDKTRTISITPLDSTTVRLRLMVSAHEINGAFSVTGGKSWKEVGVCELPTPGTAGTAPQISLQCYQGAPASEHWTRVSDFKILRREHP